MILIDDVIAITDNSIAVRVNMHEPSLFSGQDGRVPSYVGIEFMAQATAAFIGYQQLEQQKTVKLGFLLGSRHYHCVSPFFLAGKDLTITVNEHMRDHELGIFNCEIHSDDCIAKAQIKAIQPQTLDDFL